MKHFGQTTFFFFNSALSGLFCQLYLFWRSVLIFLASEHLWYLSPSVLVCDPSCCHCSNSHSILTPQQGRHLIKTQNIGPFQNWLAREHPTSYGLTYISSRASSLKYLSTLTGAMGGELIVNKAIPEIDLRQGRARCTSNSLRFLFHGASGLKDQ